MYSDKELQHCFVTIKIVEIKYSVIRITFVIRKGESVRTITKLGNLNYICKQYRNFVFHS